MDHFDQVHQIYQLVKSSRLPVPKRKMVEKLEVSGGTVKNRIRELRDRYDAPLKYSSKDRGYYFTDEKYELQGIWFSQNELYAFLIIEQQMEQLEPGLISAQLKTLKQKIHKLLQNKIQNTESLANRLQVIAIHNKPLDAETFSIISSATLKRQRLQITYQRNSDQQTSIREISPQRLVYYKNNWYLYAYCHQKHAIRNFALDAILAVKKSRQNCKEIPADEVKKVIDSTYGIFAGLADKTATIHFYNPSSHWVAKEQWHEQQQGEWLDKNTYQLVIPYQKDEELIMDILRHGDNAKVIAPAELIRKIQQKIEKMQKKYQGG